ncbi:MAG: glutathione peroxidase [Bacteroidetes bacterium]|nr:MAG: glutathione peroxidase [Bacteroidota bacterium]
MKRLTIIVMAFFMLSFQTGSKSIYDFTVKDINGQDFHFSSLKGKRFMIVNVASKCHYTPQYKDLEALYQKYKNTGFEIVAFPANNFLWQEPGSNEEIKEFCTSNFHVSFKMMSKISVKGKNQAPIYAWLTQSEQNGKMSSKVKWNFQKYLIDENGNLVAYFSPSTSPNAAAITHWIETGELKLK